MDQHVLCCILFYSLAECNLSAEACEMLAHVLQSPNSLMELDLSRNDLGDCGAQSLSVGLASHHCKLQMLRLLSIGLSENQSLHPPCAQFHCTVFLHLCKGLLD